MTNTKRPSDKLARMTARYLLAIEAMGEKNLAAQVRAAAHVRCMEIDGLGASLPRR